METICCECDKETLTEALRGLGFRQEEIETYFQSSARESLLQRKRCEYLEGLHVEQAKLCKIDYLLWLERKRKEAQ